MKTVMLIDDEPAILELMEMFLADLPCKLISFSSPEASYEALKDYDHIDLVISDINMPAISGIELLKLVRELPSDVRWIFCSAFLDEKQSLIESLNLNVYGFYAKPIRSDELINLVKQAIS